jgi:hypothetical protein
MSPWQRGVPAALRPKWPRWFVRCAGVALGSLVLFITVDLWRGWSPSDVWGLSFGVLAAVLMVLEALYGLRRRLRYWPLKHGQRWLQVHVYGGTLAALFVLIHTGFRWPGGTFGWLLLTLTAVTTVSGLLGVAAQKIVPQTLTHAIGVEAIYERIPEMVADIREEAEETIQGAPDMLLNFYGSRVRPALAGPSISLGYLMDVRTGRQGHLTDFEGIRSFVSGPDRDRVERLQALVIRKMELEAHYTWQTVLRLWPFVHVPIAMALMATVVAHIVAVWHF